MLILTRYFGQAFYIGKDYETRVVILGKYKGKIKIGIEAPENIPIVRQEIRHLYKDKQLLYKDK